MRDEREAAPETQLTPPQIIERHLRELLHETKVSKFQFAAVVRENYERLYPEHARSVEFSSHADLVLRMQRDAEKVARWFDADVAARLPAEILDALVLAFPPARRFALEQELAGARGGLFVPIPRGAAADVRGWSELAREAGEALAAITDLFDDGQITAADAPRAPFALQQLDELVARALAMKETIRRQALGEWPCGEPEAVSVPASAPEAAPARRPKNAKKGSRR